MIYIVQCSKAAILLHLRIVYATEICSPNCYLLFSVCSAFLSLQLGSGLEPLASVGLFELLKEKLGLAAETVPKPENPLNVLNALPLPDAPSCTLTKRQITALQSNG